jgi:hypothetical protein
MDDNHIVKRDEMQSNSNCLQPRRSDGGKIYSIHKRMAPVRRRIILSLVKNKECIRYTMYEKIKTKGSWVG